MIQAALLSLLVVAAEEPQRMKPLHRFDVVSPQGMRLEGAKSPRVLLVLEKPGVMLEVQNREPKPAVTGNTVVVEDVRLLRATDAPTDHHRKPSFMLDYDEAAFAPVATESRRVGPSGDALRVMVAKYITNKSGERSFDPASVVARRREGDCTEHAVLLAAAARSAGLPARVVLGIVLVEHRGKVLGMGHAWAEIHDGKEWQVQDAALNGEAAARVYLPLHVVTDEGPGFRASGMSVVTVRQVKLESR